MGADFDGDTMGVYPLFSKEANEEAMEKMNPRIGKSVWINPSNADQLSYGLSLDSVATIYTATKE